MAIFFLFMWYNYWSFHFAFHICAYVCLYVYMYIHNWMLMSSKIRSIRKIWIKSSCPFLSGARCHDKQLTDTRATEWGSTLPCYMILSRFRSNSSTSFSWSRLDADEAPHICISISASRCSRSHCCCDNFVFSEIFSASTVCRRSRSRFISSSRTSCEPNKGVAPHDSRWFIEAQVWPVGTTNVTQPKWTHCILMWVCTYPVGWVVIEALIRARRLCSLVVRQNCVHWDSSSRATHSFCGDLSIFRLWSNADLVPCYFETVYSNDLKTYLRVDGLLCEIYLYVDAML